MKRILKLLIALFLIVNSMPVQALFYCAELWQNPENNQKIKLFYDNHMQCSDPKVAISQRDAVVKQAKLDDSIIIAEDKSHYVGSHEYLERFPYENHFFNSPLRGLIRRCKEAGVPHINVEFRHARTLLQFKKPIVLNIIKQHLSVHEAYVASNNVYDEFISYQDDNKVLQEEYANIKKNILGHRADMAARYKQLQATKALTPASKLQLANDCASRCDSELINARIMHQIAECKDIKSIDICAGGLHLDNVAMVLAQMGYQRQASVCNECIYDQTGNLIPGVAIDVTSFYQDVKK